MWSAKGCGRGDGTCGRWRALTKAAAGGVSHERMSGADVAVAEKQRREAPRWRCVKEAAVEWARHRGARAGYAVVSETVSWI